MKKIIVLFAALLLCSVATAGTTKKNETITDQGLTRTYHLYIPDNLPSGAPLVFILHGYGGSAESYLNNTSLTFKKLADEEKVMLCYPQATKDPKPNTGWNVYYPWQIDRMQVDDCEFICNLAKHLQTTYNLSAKNTFLTGMSNGGEMCYLMAYLRPELFAAVAPVSGLTMEWMYRDLKAKRAVPLFEIHGTEDKTSAWNGDLENKGGWGAYIGVPQAVGYWVAQAGCTHEESEELPLVRNKVVAHRYVNGVDGCQVWLYEVVGGKHSWGEKDMNTAEELWKFFSLYIK